MIYKHISSLFLSFCLLACSLTAQEKVTKEAFNEAVDYVNCKFAEYSLQKARNVNDYNAFKSKCNCDDAPAFAIIKEAIPIQIERSVVLASEIEKYKEEYKPGMDVQAALEKLSSGMLTNATKYAAIVEFNKKNQRVADFIKLKDSLNRRITEILKGSTNTSTTNPGQVPAVDKNTADMMAEPPQPAGIESAESSMSWYYLIMFVIGAIAVGALIVAIFTYRQLKSTHALMDNERMNHSIGLSGAGNKLESLEARYNQLHNEYQALKRDLRDAQRNDSRNTQPTSESYTPPAHVEEVLYFPSPNAEGSFNASHGSATFRDSASIYKFIITGTNRARFRIDDRSNAIVRALRSPSNVNPVCISENIWEDKYTRITTIKEGIAELEGDRWVVRSNDKARIRYEA
jgi:hypothetical protein